MSLGCNYQTTAGCQELMTRLGACRVHWCFVWAAIPGEMCGHLLTVDLEARCGEQRKYLSASHAALPAVRNLSGQAEMWRLSEPVSFLGLFCHAESSWGMRSIWAAGAGMWRGGLFCGAHGSGADSSCYLGHMLMMTERATLSQGHYSDE